jgi:iron-sulfur cluster repair protein YtfE (RIC family)
MKATTLLENQHRKVEAIFKKLEGGRSEPEPLLEELANNLAAHMAIEQDIFYPAIKEVDEDMVNESYEEHSLAEVALKRLLSSSPDDDSFKARVTALRELIEHHVTEEEEELFPEVEKALGEEALTQLGKAMKTRFDEVYEAGFEAAVPKTTVPKTSADAAKKAAARKGSKKPSKSAAA